MFAKFSLPTILAAAALVGVVRADVTPSEPGPGTKFNAGTTCTVSWEGDKDSTTAWKDMSIQLMTGDNFAMVHLTTVATAQDGTTDGRFNYPCPEVTPNSNIYFYQFTATGAAGVKTWTTRFTIASATGETTEPANPTQPGTNDPVPWGTGKLVDPSKAVAPPATAGGSATGATNTTTTTTSASTTSASTTKAPISTTAAANANQTSTAKNTTAGASAAGNGAMAPGNFMLGTAVAVASSALALALAL